MILDSNCVSIDDQAITSSAVTGNAVPLNMFWKPGRQDPICVMVKGHGFLGGTSITFKVTECDTATGTFTDVPGSSETVLLADLQKGGNLALRFLPTKTAKQWIKIVATPSGTFTAGKLTAAVVREDDLPYEDGLYIDGGVVYSAPAGADTSAGGGDDTSGGGADTVNP